MTDLPVKKWIMTQDVSDAIFHDFPKIELLHLPFAALYDIVQGYFPEMEGIEVINLVHLPTSPCLAYADRHSSSEQAVRSALESEKFYILHINDLLSFLAQQEKIPYGLYVVTS